MGTHFRQLLEVRWTELEDLKSFVRIFFNLKDFLYRAAYLNGYMPLSTILHGHSSNADGGSLIIKYRCSNERSPFDPGYVRGIQKGSMKM